MLEAPLTLAVGDAPRGFALAGTWPADLPAGLQVALQPWIVDPVGPAGLWAGHGLRATAP